MEGARTEEFDYSADRFFATTAEIAEVCGTSGEEEGFEASEVERFSSMVTFLKEWRNFHYESKTVDFAYESGAAEVGDGCKGINLSQFSSAATPKMEHSVGETGSSNSNDFVLHVGGPVWGLDWCPMTLKKSDANIKCEYLAVAAHPPGSAYHKIGLPLTGRGIVQIWCLLCTDKDTDILPPMSNDRRRPRGRPRKKPIEEGDQSVTHAEEKVAKPRGRPRKKPIEEGDQSVSHAEEKVAKPRGRPRKKLCLSVDGAKERPLGRPRGRPRKQPTPSFAILNGENESAPCSNSLISVIDESVLPLSFDLGEVVPVSPASTHLDGKEKLVVKKCRGRPRKKPVQSTNEFAPNRNECPSSSGVELGKDASQPTLREHGNPGTVSQNIVLEEATLELPVSGDLTGKCESCQPSDRCKSRKKMVPTENEGALASNIELEDDASALFTSRGLENLNSSGLSIEKVPLTSPASINLNIKEETTRRRRGRPKKKLVPNLNGHVPVLGAEFGKDVHVPSTPLVPNKFSPQVIGIGLGDVPLALIASDKKQSFVSKHSGRSKMELILSGCTRDSAVLSGEDASSLPDSRALGFSGENCSILIPEESFFDLPTSTDINVKKESSVPRRRWRPRKESAPLVNLPVPCCHHALNELSTAVLPEQLEASPTTFHGEDGSTTKTSVSRNCCQCAVELDQTSDAGKKIDNKPKGVATTNSCCPISSMTNEKKNLSATAEPSYDAPHHNALVLREEAEQNTTYTVDDSSSVIPKGIALPRVVLCLAHNGKVAWDVKWRPCPVDYSERKCHMGYIAVLLGNGSLEVWEVPLLSMVKTLYASSSSDSIDPRFLKLKPVFKCSKVKCGDRKSIPLTVEWSPSANPDLLLAGFHDGTVAIWKFSMHNSSQDTNPLVCFTADSVPIRALAWAPDESDMESANLIVTAEHEGLKIWDIRDPYRPLWELNPVQRVILSLDWLKDPRCIILSFDDGTLRTISLWNAACDVPVTGKPYVATKQLGMHSYQCSAFTIWSIQVSRATGIIAYCGADGRVAHFQVTSQSVDKEAKRYRQPHFLCGSLVEEGQTLKIRTPLPNTPLPEISFAMKKSSSECGEAPRTISSYLADVNQILANPHFPAGNPQTSRRKTSTKPPRGSVKKQPKQNSGPAPDEQFVPPGEAEEGTLQLTETNDGERERKIEVLPPKIIAMHRVRWNMNKGSERWLCHGGAAGIVRCQEIALPTVP